MALISAVNFRKQSTLGVEDLILEYLIQAGFKIELNAYVIQDPGGIDIYAEVGIEKPRGILYLKVGDSLFLENELKEVLASYMNPELEKKVIFLSRFNAFMNHPNNFLYTLAELIAINSTNLKDKIVLDLGCAEGSLGLLALKKGARKIYGVDINEKITDTHRKNLEINGIGEEMSKILTASFGNRQLILESIPINEIDMVFANIGPHFGRSDLEALSLLEFLPGAQTVVGAGYNLSEASLSPVRALFELGKHGFKQNLRFYVPKHNSHAAFVINR